MSEILNNWIFVFWICVLLHLIADYNLQGILANMKQVSWWRKQTTDKKYEHDWIAALMCHSFMWAIFTFLPLMFLIKPCVFSAIVILNAMLHACIDVIKANLLGINLVEDQILHIVQITATIYICYIICTISV